MGCGECRRIGRPSTRAPIIDALKAGGYIKVEKDTIYLGQKGRRLIEAIKVEEIKSPLLTVEWERKLDEIESLPKGSGKLAAKLSIEFIRGIEAKVRRWVTAED
jgi:DNA topoisomerase IA